ncbi:hypothetical protein BV898_09554 [Hypsibius exemplaris]|uniref:Protein quiver n=1 Tax=Hypsibius exemplaris TaxID=2072580 RepID=A0A1W0WM17_HYPEX|nr:hypothetical protein BV898_09554 [Hypsibius exemplaris]
MFIGWRNYLTVLVEFILYFITTAVAERCYDCDSRNHKGCAEIFSGSALIRNCAKSQLDPEQDRCMKMQGNNIVMRSCVKQGSPAASMDDGRCIKDHNDITTCVCSGYLCNEAAPPFSASHSVVSVVLLGPFFRWWFIIP